MIFFVKLLKHKRCDKKDENKENRKKKFNKSCLIAFNCLSFPCLNPSKPIERLQANGVLCVELAGRKKMKRRKKLAKC